MNQSIEKQLSVYFSGGSALGSVLFVVDFPKGATSAMIAIVESLSGAMAFLDSVTVPQSDMAMLYVTPMVNVRDLMAPTNLGELEQLVQETNVIVAAKQTQWNYRVCECAEDIVHVAMGASELRRLDVLEFQPLEQTQRIPLTRSSMKS